jgi:para-aminobenzoate synthetase/4-amino-4-deoxychorismate lyase
VRLADHLARLDRSCRELYGRPAPDLAALARDTAATATGERAVLRLVLCADGTVETSCRVLGPPPTACEARVVHGRGGLWRHKWADRARLAADEAAGTPLYVASDATVLETSRGNVFLVGDDGALVTPPLRDDLLPGVTRRALLDLARDRHAPVSIRPFGLAEMMASPAFWTSSLSGAVPIHAVDGVGLPRADSLIDELARALFVR